MTEGAKTISMSRNHTPRSTVKKTLTFWQGYHGTYCDLCIDWESDQLGEAGVEAWEAHRDEDHPQACRSRLPEKAVTGPCHF